MDVGNLWQTTSRHQACGPYGCPTAFFYRSGHHLANSLSRPLQSAMDHPLPIARHSAFRWLKLAAVLILWGVSFILNEIALRDLGPAAVVSGRWLVTALLVLALVARQGQVTAYVAALRVDGRRFLLLSLVGVTLLYGLQVAGQARTSTVNTGLLANTAPVFTALLAIPLLHERLRRLGWLGIVLAMTGSWIVSAGGLTLELSVETTAGDLLVLLSAFFAALYFVIGKGLLGAYSPLLVTAAAASLGAATLLPFALMEGSIHGITWPAALAVVGLGVGPGLLSNLWWWQTAQWLEASRAAMYIYLIPLITIAFAIIFLGETVALAQLVGTALVLGGVWMAERASGG